MLILAALALAEAPAEIAPSIQGAPVEQQLSAPQVFAMADAMVRQGRSADAETLLTGLTQDASLDYRSEARFRLGRLRAAVGDLKGAIRWYRLLLEEKPDAQAVRLELAHTYALADEEAAARRELRRASAIGLPDDVAAVVDQFSSVLRTRRRVGGVLELAIAPDSNINRATASESIGTVLGPLVPDDDAKRTSGVGLSVGASGFWRSRGNGSVLLARVSGRGDFYGRERFNDVTISAALGPELRVGRSRWRPAVTYAQRWFGGDTYSRHAGGSVNWARPLTGASQIEVEASALGGRYPRLPAQNGLILGLAAHYERAIGQSLSFRTSMHLNRTEAKDAGYVTTGATVSGLAARRIGAQTVFGEVSVGALGADGRLNLFPRRREDGRADLTIGLLLNRWRVGDLSPVVRVRHTENWSTVDVYRFRQTRVEFALSRDF